MIYTITLNPALDRTIWVKEIKADEKSTRIEKEFRYAGGKGIDVSKMLTNFEVPNTALGFIGGFTGEEIEGRLLNDGIQCDFTRIYGETRTNIIIHENSTGRQILLSAEGPEIQPHQLMQFIRKLEDLPHPEVVILSGSLPPGVHPQICHRIIKIAKEKGSRVLLDADGEVLRIGIQAQPDIIKPNVREISRLVGSELTGMEDILRAAQTILEQGVGIVLVSMGAKGILMVGDKAKYHAVPPSIKAENTVGAGDSSVAGFIYGLTSGKDLKQSLVYAVAAGTATAMKPGTALGQREDFINLIPQIEIRQL